MNFIRNQWKHTENGEKYWIEKNKEVLNESFNNLVKYCEYNEIMLIEKIDFEEYCKLCYTYRLE